MALTTKRPVERLIFDDGIYYNWENLREECLVHQREKDPNLESVSDAVVQKYALAEHIISMNRDFNWVLDAIGDMPLIGVGGREDDPSYNRFFIVENIFFVRAKVLNEDYDLAFRAWDENGRCFCESYDYEARNRGEHSSIDFFEVRQLNKRGVKLLSSLKPDSPVPVDKLFSKRYSDPPRIAELAFKCPPEEWEEVPIKHSTPESQANEAKNYLRNFGGFLSGTTNVKIER